MIRVTFKPAHLRVLHILPERRRPLLQDHMIQLEEGRKNLTAESLCRGIAQATIARQKKLYRTPWADSGRRNAAGSKFGEDWRWVSQCWIVVNDLAETT